MNSNSRNRELIGVEGEIYLPSWKGFLWNGFNSKKTLVTTDFLFEYFIGGDSTLEFENPEAYQHKANEYFMKNEEEILNKILDALVSKYPEIQEMYDYEPDEMNELMPDITNPDDFKKIIKLIRIHFPYVKKDDIGYIGFEFDCKWDIEHGLGVMTHKKEIIEIGGADTSFMEWVAEKDLASAKS